MRQPAARASLVLIASFAGLIPVGALEAAPGVPEVRVLENGLQVVLLEDHTLPLLAASLWVHAGSKDEIESSAGYAHFLEHLVQRGTESSGPFEFQRLASRRGGALSVRSNYDRTSLTVTGVSAALEDLLAALAAMAFHAGLAEKEIDLELGTLSQEIRNYYNLPASVAFLEAMRHTFPDHPYRFPMLGNYRTVGTLKSAPLVAFYRNLYAPNNMALALAGDFEPKKAWPRIEAAFGKAGRSATLPARPASPPGFAGHTDVEKRLDLREAWANITFAGPGFRHPDRAALEVIARALNDGGVSSLQASLLKGGAGSPAFITYYGLEDGGMLYFGLKPASPEGTYDVAATALEEIVAFKKRGLREGELRAIVDRLIREERVRAEQIQERAERLGEAALFGGVRYYWDLPEVYARLTPEQVKSAAAKYLVEENLRLVVILPKNTPEFPATAPGRFHKSMDALGKAAAGSAPAFAAALYPPAEASRVTPAAWGNPRDAERLKEPERTVLPNGLTLVVQEDHRHSLAAAAVQLRVGSADDPPGKEGLAGLTLRVLAAGAAVSARQQTAGGAPAPPAPGIQLSRDLCEIRLLGSPASLRPGLEMIAAALRPQAPSEASLAEARRAAIEALDRGGRDPSAAALDLFREKVYAGHSYARPPEGTTAGLKAITPADVASFQSRHFRPSRAVLAVTGDVIPGDVARLVKSLWGDWKEGPESGAPPKSKEDAAAAATAKALPGEYTRILSSSQSDVLLGVPGVPVGHADVDDLRLLGTALTIQAFDDMIFNRRAAFSAVAVPEALRGGGALAIEVVTQPLRRDEAVFDLQRLARRLALEDLPEADLADLGRMQAGRGASGAQGTLALASLLSYREAAGIGALAYRREFDPLQRPVAARLKEVAGRYLRPEAWIVVKVGPASP